MEKGEEEEEEEWKRMVTSWIRTSKTKTRRRRKERELDFRGERSELPQPTSARASRKALKAKST